MLDCERDAMDAQAASLLRGAAAGLIAGVVASFAMDRFQAAIAALSPPEDRSEPATDKTANAVTKLLTGRNLASSAKPLGGQLIHYALGGGLGLMYGIAAESSRSVTKGYGTAFGTGIALILDETAVPALGLAEPPWQTSIATHGYSLASHLIFGAVAEFTRRQARSTL